LNVPLNLRQLVCFIEAADAGSMTGAAERLQLSPPAVSQAIAQLEGALDVQLFIRRRAVGLTLTSAGHALLGPARGLLEHAEEVRANATALGAPLEGRLVVGCFRTAAPYLLPELIESFSRAHPGVHLDFIDGRRDQILGALRAGECEVALVYDLDVSDDIVCERIFETRHHVVLAATHPLAARPHLTIEELEPHDAIIVEVPRVFAAYVEQLYSDAGCRQKVRHRTEHRELAFALAARGLGYVVVLNRPVDQRSYEGLPIEVRPLRRRGKPVWLTVARLARVQQTRRARLFAEHCKRTLDPTTGSQAARRMRGDSNHD
jgi:DNA-binding transcriptional LysR family regulator